VIRQREGVDAAVVLGRAIRQRGYQPVFEDWLWHTILPALAYATMLVAGAALARNDAGPLFFIGPATLLLVFIGIHNAWDTVTYILLVRWGARRGRSGGARDDAREERPL